MSGQISKNQKEREAWVIFSGEADLPWLKILKPGFRHCFLIVRDKAHWIAIDGLSSHLEISVLKVDRFFDLPGWFEKQGLTVVKATSTRHKNLKQTAPIGLFTCVEVIKRFLGIRRRLIITPYQLYKRLTASEKNTRPAVNNPSFQAKQT